MKEVQNTKNTTFECLDRISLIMNRSSRTSKVIDFIDFKINGLTNIMKNKIKILLIIMNYLYKIPFPSSA